MIAWLTLLLQIACLSGPAQEPAPVRKARFVPGELIVKFRAGSEGARLASGSGAATDARTTLGPYTDGLSREIGLSVAARRILSGGEVLLVIDVPSLTDSLLGEVRREDGLKDASIQEGAEKTAGRIRPAVRARVSSAGLDTQALTKRLTERLGFSVQGRSADGILLLFVDSEAVTLRALEAVKRRPDVEYVQLNYVLAKFGS